jgi:hypothetical protein
MWYAEKTYFFRLLMLIRTGVQNAQHEQNAQGNCSGWTKRWSKMLRVSEMLMEFFLVSTLPKEKWMFNTHWG